MAIFNSKLLVYQRVDPYQLGMFWSSIPKNIHRISPFVKATYPSFWSYPHVLKRDVKHGPCFSI